MMRKTIFSVFCVALLCAIFAVAGESKKFVPLYKTSVLNNSKKKASATRWRRLTCRHCHGKGHVVVVLHKGNTSIRLLKQCPWCDGTGSRGLSKL